jgi:hypothetical protein
VTRLPTGPAVFVPASVMPAQTGLDGALAVNRTSLRRRSGGFAFSLLASATVGSIASANMTGASIGFHGMYGAGANPEAWQQWEAQQVLTVGSGVEYAYQNLSEVDFGATTIRVDYTFTQVFWVGVHDFNGWVVRDIDDTLPDFAGIELVESFGASWAPVIASVYDANTLLLNFGPTHTASETLYYNDGDYGIFEVSFVPAPGALAVLGLAGLLGRGRRRPTR